MSWLKSFFSAPDGQGSSKRLKSFIFCALACYMICTGQVNNRVHLYAFYAILITILLLDAVITVQDLSNLRNGTKSGGEAIKEGDKLEIKKVE